MTFPLHIRSQTLAHGLHNAQPFFHRRTFSRRRIGIAPRRRLSAVISSHNAIPSRTQRIMEKISTCDDVGGAGGASSYESLKKLDQLWSNICATTPGKRENYEVICQTVGPSFYNEADKNISRRTFDVVVWGGTLGIFIATALVSRGLNVCIVERNQLKGVKILTPREQEWNISRKELMELVHVGILTIEDIEQISTSILNPNRCGFEKKGEIWVEDILNLGVSPAKLLEIMKQRFVSLGGIIFEGISLSNICIYDDAALPELDCLNGETREQTKNLGGAMTTQTTLRA